MRNQRRRLESTAKTCLGTSLASLAVVAALVNAAFYSALAADYWPVAPLLGPAIMASAILTAASFILGFVLHGVVVVDGRRKAIQREKAIHAQPQVGPAA